MVRTGFISLALLVWTPFACIEFFCRIRNLGIPKVGIFFSRAFPWRHALAACHLLIVWLWVWVSLEALQNWDFRPGWLLINSPQSLPSTVFSPNGKHASSEWSMAQNQIRMGYDPSGLMKIKYLGREGRRLNALLLGFPQGKPSLPSLFSVRHLTDSVLLLIPIVQCR